MQVTKIRFPKKDSALFIPEVRERVNAYFEQTGKSTKADLPMMLKTVLLLVMTFGSYAVIMTAGLPPLAMWALTFVMGVGMAGIGFSVAHDALHGAYSANPRVNRALGFSFDLLGANGYMWKITHNVIHHTYTNIPHVDEDLTVSPLLRLSPEEKRYGFHRWQHLYGFAAYSLATINWIFAKDYQQFLKRDIGPYKGKKHPRAEIATLVAMKLVCYTYMIVLPLLLLEITWWQFAIGFLTAHMVAGTILGVIFQLAHVVEGPEFPMPDESGQMEYAWLLHEMATTANFAPKNRLLSWYVGGLNYQIEHHLFPQVCSTHYPHIAPIVKETAEKYGVPYYSQPTLFAAIRSHQRMLKKLGQPDPVQVPEMALTA